MICSGPNPLTGCAWDEINKEDLKCPNNNTTNVNNKLRVRWNIVMLNTTVSGNIIKFNNLSYLNCARKCLENNCHGFAYKKSLDNPECIIQLSKCYPVFTSETGFMYYMQG